MDDTNYRSSANTAARWAMDVVGPAGGAVPPPNNPTYGQQNNSFGSGIAATNYNVTPERSNAFMGSTGSFGQPAMQKPFFSPPRIGRQKKAIPTSTPSPMVFSDNPSSGEGYKNWMASQQPVDTMTDYQRSYNGIPANQLMEQARNWKPNFDITEPPVI